MTFLVHGSQPNSVFGVFGGKENTATFALGWTLANSPGLLARTLTALGVTAQGATDVPCVIELQRYESGDGGFTDVELRAPGRFHIIVEAKRGWTLPSMDQLGRYVSRLGIDPSMTKVIVSVSAASQTYAGRHLPPSVSGVPLVHLAWSELRQLVLTSQRQAAGFEERLWLRELSRHLEGYVSMQNPSDNTVYVVSLANRPIREGSDYTWIDVVAKDGRYFHPFGGDGWPVMPPNYLGFRYFGELQSVHHVEGYDVVADVASVDPRWCDTDRDHLVYRLGPAMRPAKPIRTGNIFRSGRVWCAIDTLLSGAFATISDARDETRRRLSAPLEA